MATGLQHALLLMTGADNIKKYWSRYYQGSQGVVFVLDSTVSDEELEACRCELHLALQHPQLCTLPFLILANHQDSPAARAVAETWPQGRGNYTVMQRIWSCQDIPLVTYLKRFQVEIGMLALVSKTVLLGSGNRSCKENMQGGVECFRQVESIKSNAFTFVIPFFCNNNLILNNALKGRCKAVNRYVLIALSTSESMICEVTPTSLLFFVLFVGLLLCKRCPQPLSQRATGWLALGLALLGPHIGPCDAETRDDLVVIPADICHHLMRLTMIISLKQELAQELNQQEVSVKIKKYFELELLAKGKRWIMEGSTINDMEAVRQRFSLLISLLEDKALQPGRL
ncbi:hypothetical protein P4O66_012354 [Electrophorus voltai]|uniref:ADP-ribosylation factor-like protein 15 n=1 Tax=Electrophorus voltai TaxID=2609070 RepID=A0AAD9DTA7_9TELE|nr:hypothetical protein P4O66_012354 [Electrophorus voltai]